MKPRARDHACPLTRSSSAYRRRDVYEHLDACDVAHPEARGAGPSGAGPRSWHEVRDDRARRDRRRTTANKCVDGLMSPDFCAEPSGGMDAAAGGVPGFRREHERAAYRKPPTCAGLSPRRRQRVQPQPTCPENPMPAGRRPPPCRPVQRDRVGGQEAASARAVASGSSRELRRGNHVPYGRAVPAREFAPKELRGERFAGLPSPGVVLAASCGGPACRCLDATIPGVVSAASCGGQR